MSRRLLWRMTPYSGGAQLCGVIQTFNCTFDDPLHLVGILHLAAFGKNFFGIVRRKPTGIAVRFVPRLGDFHFHQESFDDELAHAGRLPENALRVQIEMKVPGFDMSADPGFLPGLLLGGLAVGNALFGSSLGESPFATAVRIDKKKFDLRTAPAVTDRSYL